MKKLVSLILVLVVGVSLVSASASAFEQEHVTIQMTYPPSANATCDLEMQWVREQVLEQTGGMIEFELYPGQTLATDKVALDSILTGTLDSAGITYNAIAQTIPQFNTRCLPFCFDSPEHYWATISDPQYKAGVQEILDDYDLVYLGNIGCALRGLGTTREIHTLDDVQGMKLRIMDGKLYQDMYTLWGFGTSTISFGEVYTAIQQGVVEGCDIDLNAMEFMAIGEVCPFYLETYQVIHGLAHIVSKSVWDKITPENQEIILDVFSQVENGVSYDIWKDYYDKSKKVMEDWGVKVSYVTDEEFEAWKAASQPIYEKYKDIIGVDYYNAFMALVDSHRP